MGCFNVACSISKLSINHGDPIVFVPLLSKTHGYSRSLDCYADRMLIYSNAIYNPMTFPIKGKYNDYGSIEDVERDANVEAIEKFFKLKVEDLVGYDERDYPLNTQSHIFENYSLNFNSAILKKFGFKGYENSFFFLDIDGFEKSDQFMVVLKQSDNERYKGLSFDIVEIGKKDIVIHEGYGNSGHSVMKAFREKWKELTGWELGVPSDSQHLISIFDKMGGMFFHRDVYEAMMKGAGTLATAAMSQYVLEKLGFELYEDLKNSHHEVRMVHKDLPDWYFDVSGTYYSKVFKISDKAKLDKDRDKIQKSKDLSVCGAEALKLALKHHANYDLDISILYKETVAGREFDVIKESLKNRDKFNKNQQKYLKKLDKLKDGPKKEEIMNFLVEGRLADFSHPLRSPYSDSGFDCRSWPFFREIYEDSFRKGSIRKDWVEWNLFAPSAYSANVHWAPAMNGEQHGNDEESRKLYNAAISILDERKTRYAEENDDYEEEDTNRDWYS